MNTKRRLIILAIMLLIAVGNYTRITDQSTIRTIEFLSIFVIGALTSLLIREIATLISEK